MTKLNAIEKAILTIEQLNALAKNKDEAEIIFKECQLNIDQLETFVDDIIQGLREIHSIIYNHKADKVYIDNIIKCKDHYCNKGCLEWEADSFIDATYELFDVVIQNGGEGMEPIVESVLGESFMDLFSTSDDTELELKQCLEGDLWNFIDEEDDELYELFLSKFADDLDGLKQMLDEYTVKLVNIHKYMYGYDHSQFTTVYSDSITMIKCCYFENRHKTDLLRNTDFMGAINFLDETISKKFLSRESVLKLVDVLFEDEFEGLTDFDLNTGNNGNKDIVTLEDEYNDFYRQVNNFYDELHDLLACGGYHVESREHDLLYKVSELFDKHVEL